MANMTIERVNLEGVSVVGQPVHLFSVGGVTGTLADAVAVVEGANSLAIEDAVQAAGASLRQRNGKLKELGTALSILSAAQAFLATSDSVDDTYVSGKLQTAADITRKYGLDIGLSGSSGSGWKISKGDATKAVAIVQQAINSENNEVTRASQSVQNFLGSRRLAFDREEGIIVKYVDSAKNIIRNIG